MAEDYASQAFMRAYFAIKNYKDKYNDGITIILGAGCSLTSAIEDITTESIITKCLQDNYDSNYIKPGSWEMLYQDFIDKLWSHKGEQEKVDMLSRYLGYLKPSKGYRYLQKLIEAGFVSNIITTNFDMITDVCCQNMDIEKWVVDKKIKKPKTLSYITLLKAHGDLETKKIRFTPDELRRLPKKTEKLINKMTHRVVVLLGWRGQDGGVLDSLDIHSDFSCYWVSPNKPNQYECMNNTSILRWMEAHNSRQNFIYGKDYGYFDEFMEKLSEKLLSSTKTFNKGYCLPLVWQNNTIVDMISMNQHIFQSFLNLLNIFDKYFKKQKWNISSPYYAKNYNDILKPCLLFFRAERIPDFMLQIPNNETDSLLLGLALELRARLNGLIFDNKTLENIKKLYETLEYRCVFNETFWKILQYLIDPSAKTWLHDNIVDVRFMPDNHLILYTRSIPVDDIKSLINCLELLTFFAPTCSVSRKEETFNIIKRKLENQMNSTTLLNNFIEIQINSLRQSEFSILKDYILVKKIDIIEDGENSLKGKWITICNKNIPHVNMDAEMLIVNTLYDAVRQHAKRKTNQYLQLNCIQHGEYVPLKISQILNEFKSNDYSGLVIVGSSGCGKSSSLKKFIEAEVDNGNLCIPLAAFMCNLHLNQSNPFFEEIFPEMKKEILCELHDSCKQRNNHIFFLIDGLNEFSGTNVDAVEIYQFVVNFCATISKEHFHNFKVIISCRPASFFYYMDQSKMCPSLNEFMNFIENDSLEPVPYYRTKALSKEEINRLCNAYFNKDEKKRLFRNFIEGENKDVNVISPFFIAIASTLSSDAFCSPRKNDLFEIYITKMLANVGSELDLIMVYQIFDVYFKHYLQTKYPINYFYLVQEFDKRDQKKVLDILRNLAEVNLIHFYENLMSDAFRFLHDKIEEYFLLAFLKANIYSNNIINAFELVQKNVIFKESYIYFFKFMFEKKRQEFIFVFSKIYSEYPDGLADILGKAFQICETSVIESFLDIGPNTLEIIQSAVYGIVCSIKSYDYSVNIENIIFLITQEDKYPYLKSMISFFRYVIAIYHIYLTIDYAEAERQTQIASKELNNNNLSDKGYLIHSFQVISAIVLRNRGHISRAEKLLVESNQYFQQYDQIEEFYYITLELGSVLREQTNFDRAANIYEKVDINKISHYPILHQRLILQTGIIYKNKMQELLHSFNRDNLKKETVLAYREKAIQNFKELINWNNCKELILIEAKTELAETLILSSQVVGSDLCIKELLDNIRELLKNINAPHRILQLMRIEANYYEVEGNIGMALDILYKAKGIAEKYELPFRVFECNYQIAHMIARRTEQYSVKIISEGIEAINAAIHFCETEINSSTYLKECLSCREKLEAVKN